MQETTCNAGVPSSLGEGDPLEKEMATHSVAKILALCAPVPNRNMRELWRRKKEWLYYLSGKEGIQEASASRAVTRSLPLNPPTLSMERLHSQTGSELGKEHSRLYIVILLI